MSVRVVSIIQSNYIPWKGYFDIINQSELFVLYDEVQYTNNDWRNRNRIKTAHGIQWLTIPVHYVAKFEQSIKDTKIAQPNWYAKHWKTLQMVHGRAPYFKHYKDRLEALYMSMEGVEYLSEINETFLRAICQWLGIHTEFKHSTDFAPTKGRVERLIHLCEQAGATHYLSGPSAMSYIEGVAFEPHHIQLCYMDYEGYAEYPQAYPPFEHKVTILDLLFNVGDDAPKYLKLDAYDNRLSTP